MLVRFLVPLFAVCWAALAGCSFTCSPDASAPDAPTTSDEPALASRAAFELVAWNINSGVDAEPQADLDAIRHHIARYPDVQLFALSEVHPTWAVPLQRAAEESGRRFRTLMSEDGRQQRLALVVDTSRFDIVEWQELHRVDTDGRGRAPLAALLRDRATDLAMMVVVVHLRRGDAAARVREASVLAELLDELEYPTLLVGDFNFDCAAEQHPPRDCNEGWHALQESAEIRWRPHRGLAPTHCARGRYFSVLDYVFTANEATRWDADVRLDETVCVDAMGRGAHAALHAELRPRLGAAPLAD